MDSKKLYALIVFVVIGQMVAVMLWYGYEENYFVPMIVASIVALLVGYRSERKTR